MIRRLLLALTARLPARVISDGNGPYLERYYLGSAFGARAYLHRFLASDPDRGLHDHPWPWAVSLILAGWYIEQRRDGDHVRRWLNVLTGDTFHRVVMPHGAREVWTLFIHGPRCKEWGFLRTFDGGAVFAPYDYGTESGEPKRWWESAPKGRDLRGQA